MITTPNPPVAGTAQIWDASSTGDNAEDDQEEPKIRRSLYVDVFESIQNIVMKRERFLFSSSEQAYLRSLSTMSYEARYLLIRLCLCKRGKWHTIASLEERYKIEIGAKEHISAAIDELCDIVRDAPVKVKEESGIIDLTLDEDEDMGTTPITKTSQSSDHGEHSASVSHSGVRQEPYEDGVHLPCAEDDAVASLPELLGCLTADQLKYVGKQMKVTKAGQNRSVLMEAILASASNQSTLAFPVLTPCNTPTKTKNKPIRQLTLNFTKEGRKKTQAAVVRRLVSTIIGRCIRISPAVLSLFDRLNLVFFRSTTHSSSLLLPALLAAFRKRRYADVDYIRTADIFSSRQALLDYEEALALEARIDDALSGSLDGVVQVSAKISRHTHSKKGSEEEVNAAVSSRLGAAKAAREIWSGVYDRWKALVACKDESEKAPGLERFDCGHVLTRIVYKGAEALAILREHDLEIEVLEALIAQKKWRRSRRGAWYNRLALVLMTHSDKTEKNLEAAVDVVIRGLQDELTHLTYRPRLERRLTRLENKLKVPTNERHKCDARLKKAKEVYIEGVRVRNRASSVVLDKSFRLKDTIVTSLIERSKSETPFTMIRPSIQPPGIELNESGEKLSVTKGKTLWIGKQGEEISVEQFALEHYYALGYKGFHSEGRIVSTIFGLLFWDAIFAPVPGAFETPYQSAPLDIFEDSFYSARRELIDQRLSALQDGQARALLEQVHDREGPRRTWCIGVDWDFEREDLLEIVDCLGGQALAIICQILCEDYGQWRGGVPDLLVWNAETRECIFVEVKSPNDSLQENQKVWIDVLIGSGILVNLCHVTDKGMKGKKRKALRAHSHRLRSKNAGSEDSMESEFEEGVDAFDQFEGHMTESGERTRDPHDFVPSSIKRRRVEVEVVIPRRPQKRSCT